MLLFLLLNVNIFLNLFIYNEVILANMTIIILSVINQIWTKVNITFLTVILCAHTLSKISLTLASDSPNHMVSNSGPFIEIKLAWHSFAIALANNVLPQPGGP